jgi:tetratricopeptide (TPR) repeat protein
MQPAGERDRKADLATLQAIGAIARSGDHARAAALAESALADGLQHPLLFNLAALRLEQDGRLVEAENLLRRAVQLAPADIASLNALGLCLLRQERPQEALATFDEIVKLDPALPFVFASRGNSLMDLSAIGAAEASYQRALELDANQGPALAGLARIAANRGAYADARSWAQKALAVLPQFPDAVMSLAAAELGQGQVVDAESRLRDLLSDPRLSPTERAYANGLLGDVLDARGLVADAFASYTLCNEELRRVYASRFAGKPGAREYLESMASYFEHSAPQRWKPEAALSVDGSNASGHVFLLGFPRSGTTLMEVILEGHPDVVSLEERELLVDSVREWMRHVEDLDRLANAPAAALEQCRASYWRRVTQAGADVSGKIFVDKHPLNSLKLPLIARLFPKAKILFACRDPRDIVLSCYRHRFQMSAPIYELLTLEGAASYYAAAMRLAVQVNSLMGLDVCLVRHEDLVTHFTREMRRICDFLRLQWNPAMGDFALRTKSRSFLTPSTAQLVRGLNTEGLGHWHRYRTQLEPVLSVLEPWIRRFLYD